VDRVVTIRDGSTSSETVRRVADIEALLARGGWDETSAGQEGRDMAAALHVYEEYVVVDGAGRLQLPPDLRDELGITDRVTLERTDGGILIRPVAGLPPIVSPEGQIGPAPEGDGRPAVRTALGTWLKRKVRTA
jgi:bifunctional DNA-binding transcriptional regulator/antitoxin component of YhaV-PrlF toxin-antitoxin module